MTDALGVQVTLAAPPERVVSLTPDTTETVFAIGQGARLVGVSDFCDYPPEAARLVRVGGIVNPSVERIVSLRPDLVLATRGVPGDALQSLRGAGLTVFGIAPEDLEGVIASVGTVGRLLGAETAAEALQAGLRGRRDAVVRQAAARLAAGKSPGVLFMIQMSPVFAAGPGSFVDDMTPHRGGRTIVAPRHGEHLSQWPQYSTEAIIEQDPDIIVAALAEHGGGAENTLQRLRAEPAWRSVRAVQGGQVYDVDADIMVRAGPRLFDGLEELNRTSRPGRAGGRAHERRRAGGGACG